MEHTSPPRSLRRAPVLVLAILSFVAIAGLRFAVEDPTEPVAFLMVVPIGLAAVELGLKGGLLGAGLASAFLVVWDAIADPELTSLGFLPALLGVPRLRSHRGDAHPVA